MPRRLHFTSEQIRELFRLKKIGHSKAEIARRFQVSVPTITRLIALGGADYSLLDADGNLTDLGVEQVKRLVHGTRLNDYRISQRIGCTVRHVQAIRMAKSWNRGAKHYVIDGKKLTVSEIAKLAGLSRDAVQKRIREGHRGPALLKPRYDKSIRAPYPAQTLDDTRRLPKETLRDYALRRQSEIAAEAGKIVRVTVGGLSLDIPYQDGDE